MHKVTTWEMWFQQLYAFLGAQQRRIDQLEKQVGQLQSELAAGQKQKTIHIDRIEYKFDQLKVEKLEGTLSIGINPGALEGIADATVNGAPITGTASGMGGEQPVDTEEAMPGTGEEGIGPGTRMPPGMEGWQAPPRPGSAAGAAWAAAAAGGAGGGVSGGAAGSRGQAAGHGGAASGYDSGAAGYGSPQGASSAAAGAAAAWSGAGAAGTDAFGRAAAGGGAAQPQGDSGNRRGHGGQATAGGNRAAQPWSELEREVAATINRYLQQEVRDDLQGLEARYHFPLDEGYRDMLVDDIRGQIDGRIRHYVQQYRGGDFGAAVQTAIADKTKADIRTALDAYLSQLPIQKGDLT